jgi:hypothetical protein
MAHRRAKFSGEQLYNHAKNLASLWLVDGDFTSNWIYWTFWYTARDYTLYFTITHTHTHTYSVVSTGLCQVYGIAHTACYWKIFFALYTVFLSVQALQSMSCLAYVHILCYNGSLVIWTVVKLTADKSKPLCCLCLASPCPMLRICTFSWFCMTSACRLHKFVT